ncbi:MAG: carboxypeptidase M32 [Spirochaetales bacterium]|nr:carboxypeptidase M32 [Spirochaetales bacterium]
MTEQQTKAIEKVQEIDKEVTLISHIGATISWDQETYMPEQGVEEKSEQSSLLSRLAHDHMAGSTLGNALATLGADEKLLGAEALGNVTSKLPKGLSQTQKALVRKVYRNHFREAKIPEDLVMELSQTGTIAQSVWAKARNAGDFASFQPYLEKLVDLKRREADVVGYEDHPYDALLDTYEPGMKTAQVTQVFKDLRAALVPLVKAIAAAPQVDDSFLQRTYPLASQEAFGLRVLKDLGYDMDRGRMDVTAHPFTTSLGRDDVRITTRYAENFFKTGIFSIIHEAGHGLYELGFGPEIRGSSLADGTSLGVHESQSRTWENMIGRSRPFWNHYLPLLKTYFPGVLDDLGPEAFYRGINKVEPSFIRVEADEVTYSLHIMLRFFLETKLMEGSIKVKDLPDLWRAESRDLLGIDPDHVSSGVLQDVHWSFGLFGYFPTYSLGNIIGAQFYQVIEKDLGGSKALGDLVGSANFEPILSWMRTHIHQYGAAKTAGELLSDITGGGLDAKPFVNYLTAKYTEVYGL